ncbi:ATP-binding cassette domain-containing protein [Jiella sp. 40Bstr34]|uniref:ATP-binding cassette domain-containing protein n=2 Tax=Jiella pacifica TaxID=2696469 RepID=A0A6N9T637_9HYPH|nr:ATP-binding cassette domain-containing protein [Jiella pacifica]
MCIRAHGLTKRYGGKTAVDGLSFSVQPGVITGFLGPNGAGKSTTLRMLLGLIRPTQGAITIGGRPIAELEHPARTIGALLDARAVHPQRTAYDHLLAFAHAAGLGKARVDKMLDLAGLSNAATSRPDQFSLGMYQRLGLATALLGDPDVLVLDEPLNGLDPEGIRWMRSLMRSLASKGRTILFSSHLMSEMEITADNLIVIGNGRLIADSSLAEFIKAHTSTVVLVRTAAREQLARALSDAGMRFKAIASDTLHVAGADPSCVGGMAAKEGITLDELTTIREPLEKAFLRLTRSVTQYEGQLA